MPSDRLTSAGGFRMSKGVDMPPDMPLPATAEQAAQSLGRPAATIRVWAHRYRVPRTRRGRHVYYDLRDLQVIERELHHGHPVPPTPEERAAIRLRCPHHTTDPDVQTAQAA